MAGHKSVEQLLICMLAGVDLDVLTSGSWGPVIGVPRKGSSRNHTASFLL